MSSSGPLSIALSFHKPFIISQPLQKYTQTRDLNVTPNNLTFPLSQKGFDAALNNLLKSKNLTKLTQLSKNLAQKRSWVKIAKQYLPHLTSS